jgi:hypothetical protein
MWRNRALGVMGEYWMSNAASMREYRLYIIIDMASQGGSVVLSLQPTQPSRELYVEAFKLLGNEILLQIIASPF